ncbi:tetratricopeptide repeat-containing protein kinase family protein [Streptomyces sp. NPDC049949]|uniref:tetratricopeptide repeat-containing protein kinase family protein n=1 Tax=Streptomyces sp. NPDC049949 TaxID=3154627 RepID=UPI003425EC1C
MRVLKVMAESGAELSHEELLDAIWLAGKLPRDAAPLARFAIPATDLPQPDTRQSRTPSTTRDPAERAVPAEPVATGSQETDPAFPLLAATEPKAVEGAHLATLPALAVRAPDSRLISAAQIRLGKSLRPMRQRFPDRRRRELDVTRTVAAMADTGVPEIVTSRVRTRWLSLALIVDDGVSMVLWQRLAVEVRALMERAGAFRDVRVYGLDTRSADATYLSTSPYHDSGRRRSPETVSDPTGDTLVLVVSDGVGEAWRDGRMQHVMSLWARCGPTAIVQTLPARLWASSGVAAQRWQVTTHRRGGPTLAWHVTDPILPPDLVSFDSVPVPVLEPTPTAVAEWARLISSPGGTALLPLWNSGQSRLGSLLADTRPSDDAESVLRFRGAASPEAYRLAAHLAAVGPVTPPVMRLVQKALGPPTDSGHTMEVFLGGLMHQLTTDEPNRLPHQRRFDFSEDARRVLLGAVSPRELMRTTGAVTEHIEAAIGRSPAFPAWVGHPDGAAVIGDAARSFGWLKERLLRRLGVPPIGVGTTGPHPARRDVSDVAGESPRHPREADEPLDPQPGALPSGWSPLLPEDPLRLGRFRLQARSTRGWPHMAMYLALDEDETTVTVRTPSPSHARDRKAALEFVRTEAECLLRMRGTYAPDLLDIQAHTVHDRPWLAASCVLRRADDQSSGPAPNLRAFLEEHGGTVPDELFLRVGRDLSQAVNHAHSLGLVHGGLAPRAVLVTDRDVRLVGWMTATVDGVHSDHRDVFPLSDTYVEGADDGLPPTPASDVYSVGALLLAFLAGRWPEPGDDVGRWTDLAESRIDPSILEILWRCLETVPARRPSAATLVEAFTARHEGPAGSSSRQVALTPAADSVRRYRMLARQDPDAYSSHLARSLRTFSNQLAGLGRLSEALAAAEEAVYLYQRLAREDPDAHGPELARTLNNLSIRLGEADHRNESLDAISEAVRLYRELVRRQPNTYGPGLASTMNNLSNRLVAMGRLEEALDAIDEAVRINRELVKLNAGDHGADLARSLVNQGNRLGGLGRRDEGLQAATEAVQLYRELALNSVGNASEELATSLNNFAVRLCDVGRHREARVVLEESVEIGRQLAAAHPESSGEALRQSLKIRAWLMHSGAEGLGSSAAPHP